MFENSVIKTTDLEALKGLQTKKATFNYLDEEEAKRFELIQQLRNGELEEPTELMMELYHFDHYYDFSDDGQVWRAGRNREEELKERIEGLNINEVDRATLMSGLKGVDQLKERWPAIGVYTYLEDDPDGKVGLALQGYTDDDLRAVNQALALVVRAATACPVDGKCVFTKAAPNPRSITDKVCVNSTAQRLYLDFEAAMTKDKLKIIQGIMSSTVELNGYHIDMYRMGYQTDKTAQWCISVFKPQENKLGEVMLFLNPKR